MSFEDLDKYLIEYIASFLDIDDQISLNRILPQQMQFEIPTSNRHKCLASGYIASVFCKYDVENKSLDIGPFCEIIVAISKTPYLEMLRTNDKFCTAVRNKTKEFAISLAQRHDVEVATCNKAIRIIRARLLL